MVWKFHRKFPEEHPKTAKFPNSRNLNTPHELTFSSFFKIWDTFEIPFPWIQLLEDTVPFTNILKYFIFEFNNET